MYRKGWCISSNRWTTVIHHILSGRLPRLRSSASLPWPRQQPISDLELQQIRDDSSDREVVGMCSMEAASTQTAPAEPGDDVWPDSRRCMINEHTGEHFRAQIPCSSCIFNKHPEYHPHEHLTCKKHIWTLSHVYFANMGGIRFNKNLFLAKDLSRSLSFKSGEKGMGEGYEGLMTEAIVSKAEIQDKSKADTLVRLLWILQILRLWSEVVARAAVGLAVTQLEIITLSFSVLSAMIYLVNWRKPKDVYEPVIYRNPKIDASLRYWGNEQPHGIQTLTTSFFSRHEPFPYNREQRVPNDIWREEHEGLFATMLVISTVLFGVIHCAAWDFDFPTIQEKWLWRSCSVSGLGLPLTVPLMVLPLRWQIRRSDTKGHTLLSDYTKDPKYTELLRRLAIDSPDNKGMWRRLERTGDVFGPRTLLLGIRFDYPTEAAMPEYVRAALVDLTSLDEEYGEFEDQSEKLRSRRRFYQLPFIVIYLITRLIIIVIAFTSFRKAPRSIYKDTWAAFVPTFH
jgi:hypothetical protein